MPTTIPPTTTPDAYLITTAFLGGEALGPNIVALPLNVYTLQSLEMAAMVSQIGAAAAGRGEITMALNANQAYWLDAGDSGGHEDFLVDDQPFIVIPAESLAETHPEIAAAMEADDTMVNFRTSGSKATFSATGDHDDLEILAFEAFGRHSDIAFYSRTLNLNDIVEAYTRATGQEVTFPPPDDHPTLAQVQAFSQALNERLEALDVTLGEASGPGAM
jgi:hypothetical protein